MTMYRVSGRCGLKADCRCMCICMYVCMYVCARFMTMYRVSGRCRLKADCRCMYVCMYVCIHDSISKEDQKGIIVLVRSQLHMYVHMCTRMYCVYIHRSSSRRALAESNIDGQTRSCTHACICLCIYVCIHTQKLTKTSFGGIQGPLAMG